MIVRKHPTSRPARSTRMLIVSAALVALATFPVALPAESKDGKNDREPERIACTITLKDGTEIEGYIVRLADDRMVIQRKTPDGATAVPQLEEPAEIENERNAALPEIYEVELSDCITIAFHNADVMRQLGGNVVDGRRLIVADASDPQRLLNARGGVENLVRDVETAYWLLWLKHRELDVVKAGRDEALEIWKSVRATHVVPGEHTQARREAQSRAQFFAYRALVETTLSDLMRAENRLRYLLGMTTRDGRLMQPSDEPKTDRIKFWSYDFENAEALAKRTELLKARLQLLDRTAQMEKVRQNFTARMRMGPDDHDAMVRHHELLVDRERAMVRDTELEVSHQVADALRDIDRDFKVAETRFNALITAQGEFQALRHQYEVGDVELDFLLDALQRKTEAERNFHQACADYAISIARVHERKGTLLEWHGIEIVQEPAADPELENQPSNSE
jgi:hypothetical protein